MDVVSGQETAAILERNAAEPSTLRWEFKLGGSELVVVTRRPVK